MGVEEADHLSLKQRVAELEDHLAGVMHGEEGFVALQDTVKWLEERVASLEARPWPTAGPEEGMPANDQDTGGDANMPQTSTPVPDAAPQTPPGTQTS